MQVFEFYSLRDASSCVTVSIDGQRHSIDNEGARMSHPFAYVGR